MSIRKKILSKKINGSVGEINILGSSINQKPNSAMPVMFCTGVTFVKKSSCLIAKIVSFDTVGLHLLLYVF